MTTTPIIHSANRHPMGWVYRGILVKKGTMRPGFKGHYRTNAKVADGAILESKTLTEMKSLIDRLLDGPATL